MSAGAVAVLVENVERALEKADVSTALTHVRKAVLRALRASRRTGSLNFGDPAIDALCLRIGAEARKMTAKVAPCREDGRSDVFLASELYLHGGHTAALGDFVRASPLRRAVLLVTDIDNRLNDISATILARVGLSRADVSICPYSRDVDKLVWLHRELDRLEPERVFLFNHEHDAVAIAASLPRPGTQIIFVHHADRSPCLGAFLPGSAHVDLTPFCFHCCRSKLGILDNRLFPLVAADLGARDFSSTRQTCSGLVTASAGSSSKYRFDGNLNYVTVVAQVLRLTRGYHVHIGPLSGRKRRRLHKALRQAEVPLDRVKHISHVPSLWRAMSDFGVDLFIGSFPKRGARASVEIMGSGTPAVWYVAGEATKFHDTHMKYEEASVWGTPGELLQILQSIDPAWLMRQSQAARRHYECNHRPQLLATCLAQDNLGSLEAQEDFPDWEQPTPISFDLLVERGGARFDWRRIAAKAIAGWHRLRR